MKYSDMRMWLAQQNRIQAEMMCVDVMEITLRVWETFQQNLLQQF